MSTEPNISRPDPVAHPGEVPPRLSRRLSPSDSIDTELVDKTKHQIRQLVAEIADLARSRPEAGQFFEGFLTRVTRALASVGGVVWQIDEETQQIQVEYQVNLSQTGLAENESAQQQHAKLLSRVLESGEPVLLPPHSGAGADTSGNPTEFLLIICPLAVDQRVVGLVEIFQRPGAGPTTQRGYLRFLCQMCEIANEYICHSRLRSFAEQQSLWQQIERFTQAVHSGLDPKQSAYQIANEGRRIIDCDRVSIALSQGPVCRVLAVSGLDTIERRADQVKKLGELAGRVVRAGQPLWYDGQADDLPPQLEDAIQQYMDVSHGKSLAILPLFDKVSSADGGDESTARSEPLGALIVEQLKDEQLPRSMRRRAEAIAEHSQIALANAIRHHRIPLLPVWQTLGRMIAPFRGRRLARTLPVVAVLAAIIAFFALFPWSFMLGAKGQLVPDQQRDVFAQVDGVLQEVLVDEANRSVQAGQTLARMTNNDLAVQIENLRGQLQQMKQQRLKFARAQHERMDAVDSLLLAGELKRAEQAEQSLQRELDLKLAEAKQLNVVSPIDGQVVDWKIRQNLLHRPVKKGQALMTLVAPDTTWSIELEIPERRLGYLIEQLNQEEAHPRVRFTLASHPGRQYEGRIRSVDLKLDVYSDQGNSALAIVEFDSSQIPETLRRSGTRVHAQIDCGTRSIGFVWFHEFFETVQSTWMYWF